MGPTTRIAIFHLVRQHLFFNFKYAAASAFLNMTRAEERDDEMMDTEEGGSIFLYNGDAVPAYATRVRVDPSFTQIPESGLREHHLLMEIELPDSIVTIGKVAFFVFFLKNDQYTDGSA